MALRSKPTPLGWTITLGRALGSRAYLRWRSVGPFGSVAGGAALGQVGLAASLLIVARLCSPADIGTFAVLLAYSQVASIVLTGRLEQVLPRLPSGRRWLPARAVLTTGVGLAPVAALAVLAVTARSGVLELAMVALLVAALCFCNLATFSLLAAQEYRGLAVLRISNGLVTGVAQIVGALILPEVWVLLLTYSIGSLAAALTSLPSLIGLRRARGPDTARAIMSEERLDLFVISVGSGALFSNVGLALPLVGVSILYGDAAAASFYLARRLLMLPTQLVATSVSEVSYALVARASPERIADHVFAWLRKSVTPSIALTVLGFAAIPVVSSAVGDGYPEIAWVVALLTIPAVVQMIATSLSNILLALHMELVSTFWNLGRLVGLLAIFALGKLFDVQFLTVVAVFAAYSVLAYSVLLSLTLHGVHVRRLTV